MPGNVKIDLHIHYMPPSLAADEEFFRREPYWEYLVNPTSSSRSVQGWATAERMIEDMDRAGIDRVVLQGEYFRQHEAAVARNNRVIELLKAHPNRVMAFAAIQPRADEALAELGRCLDEGMCGVGELAPYAQGYTLEDPAVLRLAEACIDRHIPLLLHTNEEIGHHYRGKAPTPLSHYYHLAARYPELVLILAHWGGGLFFYEMMPEVRKTLANVWYDTAASPLLYPTTNIFKVALQCIDHHKILYASDYPLLLYPRRQREPDFRPFLQEIDALGLEAETAADLLGNNAARLLGLLPASTAPTTTPARPAAPTKIDAPGSATIAETMAVNWVAQAFPNTRAVFNKYHLPWQDSSVPFWEPIIQSACAHGLNAEERRRLLAELNEALAR